MGCIDGEAIIEVSRGRATRKHKLKDVYLKFNNKVKNKSCSWDLKIPTYLRCYKEDENRIGLNEIESVLYKGNKKVIYIETESGKNIKLTSDHLVFTEYGWKEIGILNEGDLIFTNGINECKRCGSKENVIYYKYSKFLGYCKKCVYLYLRKNGNEYDEIVKTKGKDGYIYLHGKPVRFHHRMTTGGLLEHIYIMENYLGREIDIEEEVHHINGIRDDNRIENLEVITRSKHKIKHKSYKRFGNFLHGSGEEVIIIPKWEKIKIKKEMNEEIPVYDIVMKEPYRNFIANKIIVHNCGKTAQAIGYLAVNPTLRPALIVCPASLKLNWVNEIRKWGLGRERIQILSGRKPDGLFRSDIFIINYDILGYNQVIDEEQEIVGWYEILSDIDLKVIISDEAQFISNHKAIRTKAFKRLAKNIPHKIFLSGTPIKNCPAEFFTVLNLLDKKSFPNRWQYLNRYCGPNSNGYATTFKGLSNEKELYRLIYPLMIRREKKDVLKELPPKQKIIVPMECDPVQLRYYEQANSEFKEWVKEAQKSLSIKEHIEGLKQLAYMAKRNAVIKWIKDYLTSGEKLVVGAWHTRVLDDLEKEFGDISVRMDGSTPANKRQEVVDRFQNDDKIKLFIGNLKVAGVGITLTAASATATIELLWGPGDHDQFEDRVHRIGQEADSVLAYYLVAPDTVEEDIIDIIQEKAKMLGQVLDGESREFVDDNVLNDLLKRMKK
jgi:SWI/SNF-related matrix-associated actin-dependent regulator 1 of chromatin subfamily A